MGSIGSRTPGESAVQTSSRSVTLADVAAAAGVSRATASLVLRGSPHVTEATRQRVLVTMQNLGYVYHRAAASLRSRRSQAVSLVLPDISNPFFAELMLGAEAQLNAADHVALLGNSSESLAKQDRLLVMASEFASTASSSAQPNIHRWNRSSACGNGASRSCWQRATFQRSTSTTLEPTIVWAPNWGWSTCWPMDTSALPLWGVLTALRRGVTALPAI